MPLGFKISGLEPEHVDELLRAAFTSPPQSDTQSPAGNGPLAMPRALPAPNSPGGLPPVSSPYLPPLSAASGLQPIATPRRPGRGALGTIAHGLGEVGKMAGEIAGSAFIPNLMPMIPGTTQYKEREADRAMREKAEQVSMAGQEAETAFRGAQTEEAKARTAGMKYELGHPEQKQQDVLKSYSDALARGDTDAASRLKPAVMEFLGATRPQTMQDVNKALSDAMARGDMGKIAELSERAKQFQEIEHPKTAPVTRFQRMTIVGPDGKPAYANYDSSTGKTFDASGNEITNPAPFVDPREATRSLALARIIALGYTSDPRLQAYLPEMLKAMGFEPPAESKIKGVAPGQPLGSTGEPIGTRMPEAPTGTVRTRGQMAEDVLLRLPDIRQQLESLKGQLGPVAGRWNEFITGKVGAPNEDFASLRDNLEYMAGAITRLHLNTEQGLKPFMNMMSAGKMSPENIKAALDATENWAKTYRYTGSGRQPGLAPGKAPAEGERMSVKEWLEKQRSK